MHTRPNTYKEMHIWLRKKFTKSKCCLKIWRVLLCSDCSTPNPRENIFGRICRQTSWSTWEEKRFRIKGKELFEAVTLLNRKI